MPNIMQMMKQAATMKRDLGRVQKELAAEKSEGTAAGGKVKVVVRGDMAVEAIEIDAGLMADKPDKVGRLAAEAVNAALRTAKRKAGERMSQLTGGMDLGNLLGS